MSIAGDLLTTASPARLLCRRGTWVLEIVRLVPIERNVFQPRAQRLEGAEAVLQYLKRSGDSPALATAAGQLMRAPRSEEERSFDAVDGEWIPGDASSNRDSVRPSAPPTGQASEVSELRAELLVLRASHERLRERVQQLEAQGTRAAPAREVLSVAPTPAVMMPKPVEEQSAPEASASTRVQGQRAPAQSERAAADRPIRLPEVAAVNACLQSLIGDSAQVTGKSPVTFSATDHGARWLTRLIDEAGHDVGAIVSDQAATATLGGTLVSLPEHEIEAQRARDLPTQDVVGAMSEVANQLCETINQGAGGAHVRVKPIELLLPGVLDWTKDASSALELELANGYGRLFLFAR